MRARPGIIFISLGLALLGRIPAVTAQGSVEGPTLIKLHQEMGGPRFAGLGGTYVGLGDDASTSRVNPAGLMTLPRSLDGVIAGGWSRRNGSGILALAARPHKLIAFSLRGGHTTREDLTPLTLDSRLPAIAPSAAGWFYGGALAYRPFRRLSAGIALDHETAALRPGLATPGGPGSVGSRRGGWAFSAGLLFRSDNAEAPRIGFSYRRAVDEETQAERGASGPAAGVFRIRTPSIYSAGVSWHYDFRNSRFLLTYQQDWVRYSELRPSRVIPGPHDDFDLRLGMEVSVPVLKQCHTGCGSMMQVRGALVSLAPVPFVADKARLSPFGQGPDRRTSWTAGASFAPRRPWGGRFKLDGAYSRPTRSWLFGIAARYPESHRGDLSDVSTRRKR